MIATLLWTLLLSFLAAIESKGTISCPNDFDLIGKKCYFFSSDNQTWQDAYWKCRNTNSTLAIIAKAEQDELLRNFLNKHQIGTFERWIGGIYDWKQLKWKWGVSERPMKYQGFPRNKREEQNLQWHCITTDPLIKNRWNSGKCTLSKHYICQTNVIRSKKPCVNGAKSCSGTYHGNSSNITNDLMNAEPAFIRQKSMTIYACKRDMILLGNKCYTFSDKAMSWTEADWACRENKTRLAVIRTKHQDVKLKKFLNRGFVGKHERWLGAMYDWKKKVWRWALSGNIVQYTNFSKNYTNTPLELRWHCITLDPKYKNEWSASECTEHKHFICQTKASTVMKYNERRKKPAKKKSEAEIIVKLDKKLNNTKDVEYKFRSGIETFVNIPKRVWNKYPQRKPLKPVYYHSISAISSRSRD